MLRLGLTFWTTNAKTTDEIVKAVEPLKGFGCIQSVLFNRWGRQIFAVWYCPFSGRGDCYLHAYYYDYEKQFGFALSTGS